MSREWTDSPGVDMAVLTYWRVLAGKGPIDRRCERIAPPLRELMGVVLPGCVHCGRPIVLHEDDTRARPIWLHQGTWHRLCGAGGQAVPA